MTFSTADIPDDALVVSIPRISDRAFLDDVSRSLLIAIGAAVAGTVLMALPDRPRTSSVRSSN